LVHYLSQNDTKNEKNECSFLGIAKNEKKNVRGLKINFN